MSELNNNMRGHRWHLLGTVSALALIASSANAIASDADRPQLWIELGGDLDQISGTGDRFTPPFTLVTPTPTPFLKASPIKLQDPSRFTYGGEASLLFQPEDSDWVFSAGIKYGRSNNKRDVQQQTDVTYQIYDVLYKYHTRFPSSPAFNHPYLTRTSAKFAATQVNQSTRHMILDFQAGKDVGLGMFGRDSSSVLSAGVRLARFTSHADVTIRARQDIVPYIFAVYNGLIPVPYFHFNTYYQHGSADRRFTGVGPSLSWKASAPIAGSVEDGQFSLDWGVNGAVLFGKQKAKVSHHTAKRHYTPKYDFAAPTPNNVNHTTNYTTIYNPPTVAHDRSRSMTVPNLGASIGVSYRMQDFKMSIGYRADYFIGAVDGGIDVGRKTTLGFNGLYASVSIGLGN